MALYRARFQHLYAVERRRIPATPAGHARLHRLERPEPWPPELCEVLRDALAPETIQQYPDYTAFYDQLARFAGVEPDQIVAGLGVEEFIRSLFMLACGPHDPVVYTWPTCAMFDIYAQVFGATPVRIVADPYDRLTPDTVKSFITHETRLVILPNPGQPVDDCLAVEEIFDIAEYCHARDVVLAIDEAYWGFGAETALPLVRAFDNLLILRSFSKALGAAGLRVGYAIGQERVLQPLAAARPSGELAGPSMRIAGALMRNWPLVCHGIQEVCQGRDWLREQLLRDGIWARGRNANHVLIDVGDRAREIADRLLADGIHVRTSEPPLDRHLMVTCGSPSLMRHFYETFRREL
jgi:histidinol-phosphate aminotransferase